MELLNRYHPESFLLVIEQARGNDEWHWKPRRYFVSQVKCPSLLTNHNQTYTNCMACAVNDRCGVSERSLKVKARYSGEGTLFFQQSAVRYWPIATKLIPNVGHAHWVRSMEFQKDLCNRMWDTVEKVLCSSSKVPYILTDCTQTCTNCWTCAESDRCGFSI
jgi:hypothetical protein